MTILLLQLPDPRSTLFILVHNLLAIRLTHFLPFCHYICLLVKEACVNIPSPYYIGLPPLIYTIIAMP